MGGRRTAGPETALRRSARLRNIDPSAEEVGIQQELVK